MLQSIPSAVDLADLLGGLRVPGDHSVCMYRDRVVVRGVTGYDHYSSVRQMVAELAEWASVNGFRVESIGADSITAHTWAMFLIPRKLLAAQRIVPHAMTYDEGDADADVERVEERVKELWAKYRPLRLAEDKSQQAAHPIPPEIRKKLEEMDEME